MKSNGELLEELEEIEIDGSNLDRTYSKLRMFAVEIGVEDLTEDFMEYEELESIIKSRLEKYGAYGVKEFLRGADDLSQNFYHINGYGNVRNLYKSDLIDLKDELRAELEG